MGNFKVGKGKFWLQALTGKILNKTLLFKQLDAKFIDKLNALKLN